MKNIYLVQRTDGFDYDDFDSFVCIAKDEEEARAMKPEHVREHQTIPLEPTLHNTTDKYSGWVSSFNHVKVTFLGKAKLSQKSGLLCASFNAG